MTDAEFAAAHGELNPALRCQYPWWLPWEDMIAMWTLPGEEGVGGGGAGEL